LHCREHSTGSTELFARASASTMSRGGDEDLESIEVELSRLHRQQRVTAGQRKALNDSSSNELRKQETQLVKLRNDNAVLKEDLRLAETEHNSQQSTGGLIPSSRPATPATRPRSRPSTSGSGTTRRC